MNSWLGFGQLARTGKGKEPGAGYTIIEVMIVLAVTTILFIAIAASFSGRQGRAMFTQAVRNYEARIQTLANDILNGRFDGGERCFVNGTASDAGESKDCIFLGKLMVVRAEDTQSITVIGRRVTTSSPPQDVTTLAEAAPAGLNLPDRGRQANNYGLQVRKIYILNASGEPTTEIGVFGFLGELAGGVSSMTDATTGSRSLRLYGLSGASAPTAPVTEPYATTLGRINAASLVWLQNGIRICIAGGNGQRAEIVVGSANSQTSLKTEILETNNATNCPNA